MSRSLRIDPADPRPMWRQIEECVRPLGAAGARALRGELGAEARQRLEGRGGVGVAAAGEAGEVHGAGQGFEWRPLSGGLRMG